MSLVHLKAKQIENDNFVVTYSIESIDFNERMDWEEIGRLKIDKETKKYEFVSTGSCKDIKFVPIFLYDLDENQQKVLLKSKFKDYCCGAWSLRVHHWANTFINKNHFPETYP